jgi:protein-tyrosine phosphatase
MWRSGLALRPYFEDVVHIVKNQRNHITFTNFDIVDEQRLGFDHVPIVDCGITDDSRVLDLSKKLVDEISRGQVIYLHCWGGKVAFINFSLIFDSLLTA